MTLEDFHRVLKQQDREIKELKQDKLRQRETNAASSKVITPQSAAQKKAEEAAVLYNYELTGLPRDDPEQSKREFVMWRTEEAGIPKHEASSIEYVDMRRNYGVQTAVIKFGSKGNRTKKVDDAAQSMEPPRVLQLRSDMGTVQSHRKIPRNTRRERERERRDYLNVAWHILKELEGEERLKSDEGAYLNYPTVSFHMFMFVFAA